MIQWKKHDLPSRKEKENEAKKQQDQEKLPSRVAEMEDAMCEQDIANDDRMSAIEDAICELDKALHNE